MMGEFADPLLACEHVVEEAKARWEERDLDHRRDDITILVAKFNWDKCAGEGAGGGNGTAKGDGTGDATERGHAA